jgi:TonB family protein
MFPLPILNVRLHACPAAWQQMTPTAQGRHCAQCDTEVIDFTQSTAAELAAARAAAPGGHLCGRFRPGQLSGGQPVGVVLRPKLRRFLVALVLVCGLGMTSQEAWAQTRKAALPPGPAKKRAAAAHPAARPAPHNTLTVASPPQDEGWVGITMEPTQPVEEVQGKVYAYVEQMPEFQPGGQEGMQHFIRQHLRYPPAGTPEGRVFVSFIVGATGQLREFKVLKGIPALHAEALRVARLLNGHYRPGMQNGRAVDTNYTIPITFSRE